MTWKSPAFVANSSRLSACIVSRMPAPRGQGKPTTTRTPAARKRRPVRGEQRPVKRRRVESTPDSNRRTTADPGGRCALTAVAAEREPALRRTAPERVTWYVVAHLALAESDGRNWKMMVSCKATIARWQSAADEWATGARENFRPWLVVPLALSAVALVLGGFWLGGAVGGGGPAVAGLTRTIRLPGRVVRIGGVRYVSTPARTVHINGRAIQIRARSIPLPSHATISAGHTTRIAYVVDRTRTIDTPTTGSHTTVTTIVQTVTVPVTVPGGRTTVTGPTTTLAKTVTVPVLSTVTVTIP
jgi:hypothetical protein